MNVFVGDKLKKLRKSKNMSQEEVADFLNLSQSAYARMESGETHSWASHISKICQLFEINPNELLQKDDLNENLDQKQYY
ncbi:helix-turn-helix transcriptional regulator [Flavobacterium sp. KACC 22761]|uniref:helix-turn-helix domain-containing protein n=1 Tax=Flavobacterium sp. KACC 22761 TaxID=3092665 RepID=UPI002A74C6E8|nr:helix-turn-helix transcriptional regulator [Flavobacterium sp. KACC 22761]WPO78674.1 helix-turn-helix transcriptional regulator [Flavobacterium sp. KACC 22761]